MMKRVVVFEPYVGGFNTGDLIIREAVMRELRQINETQIYFASLHQPISPIHRKRLKDADLVLIAGSNMLSEDYWVALMPNRWPIALRDLSCLEGKVALVGVGVNTISRGSSVMGRLARRLFFTQHMGTWLYRVLLARDVLQSVRDRHTLDILHESIGVLNAANTSCPTLWDISTDEIPSYKGRSVVTQLTDYARDPLRDRVFLEIMKKTYESVYFWPQGFYDMEYLDTLGVHGIRIVPPTLEAYDELLQSSESLDYIGSRLHGGIRAMQNGRRTIILSVDHRAPVIARDVGLVTVPRTEVASLEDIVHKPLELNLKLPYKEIQAWRDAMAMKLA